MKLINKRIIFLSPLIILVFLLEACHKNGEKVILENPCLPPCWRYITPGRTNQDELTRIIENMPDVHQESIKNLGPWNIFDSITIIKLNTRIEIEFYLIKDIVTLIAIRGNFPFTYSTAVDFFGEPEVIIAADSIGPGRLGIGDSELLYISSLYPEIGFGFGFHTRDISMNSDDEIKPDSKITEFYFYDPEYSGTLLKRGSFTMGNTWEIKYWRSNNR